MWGSLNPSPPSMPEKASKKVSRACNTCRLKRKKCDGLDPCFFCKDNKVECSYSREPRRRGPPSGYLRYTETRVVLLETLLGLFIIRSATEGTQGSDPFVDAAKALQSESKTCTQDKWDAHKAVWSTSEASKIVEELAVSFAPYAPRPDQESVVKPLLPSQNANTKPSHSAQTQSPSAKPSSPSPSATFSLEQSLWPGHPLAGESSPETVSYPQHSSRVLSRESFERTQPGASSIQSPSLLTHTGSLSSQHGHSATKTHTWQPQNHFSNNDLSFGFPQENQSDQNDVAHSNPSPQAIPPHFDDAQMAENQDISLLDTDIHDVNNGTRIHDEFHSDAYTGSYWRTADFELTVSPPVPPKTFPSPLGASEHFDLPPSHIIANLLDIYFQYVHPSFPFLPPRTRLDFRISSNTRPEGTGTLILALCAYSGRLSPGPSIDSTSGSIFGGDAGKVAADLWYEQARSTLNTNLRKPASIETVQTLLLLALRDHGKGNEGQAWLLVGMAVRMGQELELSKEASHSTTKYSSEDRSIRENVWGVSLILDLFLSLQLGRPSAVADVLKMQSDSSRSLVAATGETVPSSSLIHGMAPPPQPLFYHTVALCQIISRINFYLYLNFNMSGAQQSQSEKLVFLKNELDMWQHGLPHQYRISLGHQPGRDVLEVNMLYHVAVILLYRPFSRDNKVQQAEDIFLEAASTFNVLLEKYRHAQSSQISMSTPHIHSPLSLSNPNMIYLIFTVAIAHLSGYKLRQQQQQLGLGQQHAAVARSTTMALQTQLHLLNCLDALTSIGATWELARRCFKTLDRLMDVEGMKPKPPPSVGAPGSARDSTQSQARSQPQPGLGKRKREGEEDGSGRGSGPRGVIGPHKSIASSSGSSEDIQGGHRRESSSGSQLTATTDYNAFSDVGQVGYAAHAQASPSVVSNGDGISMYPSPGRQAIMPTSSSAAPVSWNGNMNFTNLNLTPLDMDPDFFDPSIFNSARWLPEIATTGTMDVSGPSALGMVWDGEWDEGLWARSLGMGFDGGG